MADNIHPVVELLAARMESHPEEFGGNGSGRWAEWLDHLIPFVTEEERVMLRKPMMQTIHEDVLDELLNGPERRREAMQQRNTYSQQTLQNAYANQLSQYQNAMGIGTVTPSQPLTIQSGGTGATRIQTNGGIQIGNETLDEGVLKQIKNALGIK